MSFDPLSEEGSRSPTAVVEAVRPDLAENRRWALQTRTRIVMSWLGCRRRRGALDRFTSLFRDDDNDNDV